MSRSRTLHLMERRRTLFSRKISARPSVRENSASWLMGMRSPLGALTASLAQPGHRLAGLADLHHEVEAPLLLEDLRHRPPLGRGLDGVLDVLDIDAVARGRPPVDGDLELRLPDEMIEVEIGHPADVLDRCADLPGDAVHDEDIRTVELDGELALHPRERFIHVVLDGLGEVGAHAGNIREGRRHVLDQLLLVPAVSRPLLSRLEAHVEFGVVGGLGVGTVVGSAEL